MAKRPITIQLEPDLIEAIDEARGAVSRQAWIADACRAVLPRPEITPEQFAAAIADHGIYTMRDGKLVRIGDERDPTTRGAMNTRARSSTQAKRGVRSRPKGGK